MKPVNPIIAGIMNASSPGEYLLNRNIDIPEIAISMGIFQRNGQSVWEHTISVMSHITPKTPTLLLAAMFHDLGKCNVQPMPDQSMHRFPCHAKKSAEIAQKKLKYFEVSKGVVRDISKLVATHMHDISGELRPRTVRKFVANVGVANIDNWFRLRIADSKSYASHGEYCRHVIDPFKKTVDDYLRYRLIGEKTKFLDCTTRESINIEGGDS